MGNGNWLKIAALALVLSSCTQKLGNVAGLNSSALSLPASYKGFAWMSGSNLANQNGNYGSMGEESQTSSPGGRNGAFSWTDAYGNLWLFGGYGYDSQGGNGAMSDLWEFDVTENQWMYVSGASVVGQDGYYGTQGSESSSNVPWPRNGGNSWTDASGNFWLFGGEGYFSSGYADLNDLWEFDVNTRMWVWISGSNTSGQVGVYGTKGAESTANIPGARVGNTVSWTDSSGNLYLFGGEGFDVSGNFGSLNDLWRFNPSTRAWMWVSGSSAISQSGTYGVLGTASASSVPGARTFASAWKDAAGNFWLFGGTGIDSAGTSGLLNDLWMFNPNTSQWTWVSGSVTANSAGSFGTLHVEIPANQPSARFQSLAWKDSSGNFYLFGGNGVDSVGAAGSMKDFWKFDVLTSEWVWIGGSSTKDAAGVYGAEGMYSTDPIPSARGLSASWNDSAGNLWLFGGDGYDSTQTFGSLNDLWSIPHF